MRNEIQYAGRVFSDAPGAAHRLLSGDCLLGHSDLSDQLAADCLEFDVRSGDLSLGAYTEGEPLRYCYQGELIGTFYVQSVERTGRESYHFTALSAVGRLVGKLHYGGMYTGQSAGEVIRDICGDTGVTVSIKTSFADYRLYGWLPVASARDNLSQVLFAIGAALRTDANGVLRVTSLYTGPGWVRGPERCFVGGSVAYAAPVARVIVTEHKWEPGGETVALFDGAAGAGDIIRFDQPVHSLVPNGFTILESNCNYARVSTGTGTLTGTRYVHHLRDIVRAVPGAAQGKDVTVKEAWLVSLMNAVGVAERLADYYSHTERLVQEALWTGEQAGDIVRTAHPYGGETEVLLSSADLTLSGVLRAREEGVIGYRPPQPENQVYYDHAEILIGSGTWTVPEGVTSVTAVLIGPGQGGSGGSPGGSGGAGKYGSFTGTFGDRIYCRTAGLAGEGGAPGAPGTPGKVLQGTLSVSPGQGLSYRCPGGGAGGSAGNTGAVGQPTTFGTLSSANGSVPEGGYTDPISGTAYARPGQRGIKGGKGTGAGSQAIPGWTLATGDTVAYKGAEYKPGSMGASNQGNCSGGYGGGAAAGRSGGNGAAAPTASSSGASAGKGGTGATPVTPAAKARFGDGGDGGHGGGGGGGGGNASNMDSRFVGAGAGGSGGGGGQGGTGGPGGILLYYSTPKAVRSGRFLVQNRRPLLSVNRQYFVV